MAADLLFIKLGEFNGWGHRSALSVYSIYSTSMVILITFKLLADNKHFED
jgi:hypothetical protein